MNDTDLQKHLASPAVTAAGSRAQKSHFLPTKKSPGRTSRDLFRWAPLLFIVLFLIVGSRDLFLPGFYGDEALQIAPALPIVKNRPTSLVAGISNTRVVVADRSFSLMTMSYIGSLKTLLYLPIAVLFGSSMQTLRLFTLGIAALAVAATYQFTATVFSRCAAVITTLLFALDQSFILRTKVDWGPNAIAIAAKMIALAAFAVWWRRQHPVLLGVGAFLLGLGLYNKADFLWILVAVGGATILVYSRELRRVLTRTNLAAFSCSFAAGAGIFLWYNLRWPLASFRDGNPDHVRWWQPDLLWMALRERLQRCLELLAGTSMDSILGIPPGVARPFSFGTPLGLVFTGAVVVALAFLFLPVFRRNRPRTGMGSRSVLWLLVAIGLFFACATLTPAGFAHHHIINVYPWPHILIGVVLAKGLAGGQRRGFGRRQHLSAMAVWTIRTALSVGLILLLVTSDLVLLRQTSLAMHKTGGVGRWSDDIYTLANDLRIRPESVPVHITDWGIVWRLEVLLDGQIAGIDEPWPALTGPSAHALASRLLDNPQAEYVVALPGTVAFPAAWESLVTAATQRGLVPQIIATYRQRDGVPTLELCRFILADAIPTSSGNGALPGTLLVAIPNPVPAGAAMGTTTLTWSTGDGADGQLYVSRDGGPEQLFSEGRSGTGIAPWIADGSTYVFTLYAGKAHLIRLASIMVRRSLR